MTCLSERQGQIPARHAVQTAGSVLILALWSLLLLSALSVGVAAHVASNLEVARVLSGRAAAFWVARAGVERACFEVWCDTNGWDSAGEKWSGTGLNIRDVELGEGSFSVFCLEDGVHGGVVTNYGLADEERKIAINACTGATYRAVLRSLLEQVGGLTSESADAMSSCTADWIDEDEEPLALGAEDSYYMGQHDGYSCRNGPIECIEELMLVKGMTAELLEEIRPYVTVHGTEGRVNLNTAGPVVLRALAGARPDATKIGCETLAQCIVDYRLASNVFTNLNKRMIRSEVFGSAPHRSTVRERSTLDWIVNHGLLTVQSRHFYGISVGTVGGAATGERRIEFVYDRKEDHIRAWNED